MSQIDVIKESVEYEQLLKEESNELQLRGEFLIPDTHPDVQEIISVDARSVITSKELSGDKIFIEGNVEYSVLYLAREEEGLVVNSVTYNDKFTSHVEALDPEHRISCEVDCAIEHIEGKIINERKVAMEGAMKLKTQCYKNSKIDFLKDITGLKDIQILKNKEMIDKIAGKKEIELAGKGTVIVGMDKPQIGKVLKFTLNLHKKDIKLYEDKAAATCFCKVYVLYRSADGRELVTIEDDIYLNKEDEIVGISSDMVPYYDFMLVEHECKVGEDDLGEYRKLDINLLARADLKVMKKEEIDLIKDAYSPSTKIQISKDEAKIGIVQGQESGEIIVKENLQIPEGMPQANNIVSVNGNVVITDTKIADGKVKVEGVVKTEVVYKAEESEKEVGKVKGEIPFKIALDIPNAMENMKGIVKAFLENIQASIEGNSVAIKATISAIAKVIYNAAKQWISTVESTEEEMPKKKASITIYVIQPGDTLWSLSKKHCTTVSDLVKLNNIEEKDGLKTGCKMLIPGRAIV